MELDAPGGDEFDIVVLTAPMELDAPGGDEPDFAALTAPIELDGFRTTTSFFCGVELIELDTPAELEVARTIRVCISPGRGEVSSVGPCG
jgi:hypothetical protein